MMDVKYMGCCGLREISGLRAAGTPSRALNQIIAKISSRDRAELPGSWTFGAMIFTEAGRGRYGTDFAKFLKTKRLGTVWSVPAFRNPNSGNEVRTFIWTVDHDQLADWYSKA